MALASDRLRAAAEKQIALLGASAQVGWLVKGRWGKAQERKRLIAGGPEGWIAHEDIPGYLYVLFNAQEVLDWLDRTMPAREEGSDGK